MIEELNAINGLFFAICTALFYITLNIHVIKTTKENVEKISSENKINSEKLSMQISSVDLNTSKNINELSKNTFSCISELTKSVHSLSISVATLDVRQTNLEKLQEKGKKNG